ncbi:MAG: hypothetical protein GX378_00750 [Bacteroidales bacterium]|nr:hypothetical protein [Bacteroidales bacterium]
MEENGKIINSDYQSLNNISKRTATTELTELVNQFKVLTKTGTSGSNISYKIVGQVGHWLGNSWAVYHKPILTKENFLLFLRISLKNIYIWEVNKTLLTKTYIWLFA